MASSTALAATYDQDGHVLSALSEEDANADGKLNRRSTGVYTYSAAGLLVNTVSETDQADKPTGEIDGVIDYREASTFEYDSDGNLVRQVSTAAAIGFDSFTSISLLEYDSRGNVTLTTSELFANSDSTPLSRARTENTYNSRGQLVKSATETDSDGQPGFEQIVVVTIVYDGVK